jgi:hypothetical protein
MTIISDSCEFARTDGKNCFKYFAPFQLRITTAIFFVPVISLMWIVPKVFELVSAVWVDVLIVSNSSH